MNLPEDVLDVMAAPLALVVDVGKGKHPHPSPVPVHLNRKITSEGGTVRYFVFTLDKTDASEQNLLP